MRVPPEAWLCRACLGPALESRAGICARCWSRLAPLPDERCPLCALPHGPCDPGTVPWCWGDACWDYHGGLGSLLVPGIKGGERGWMDALLERFRRRSPPEEAYAFDRVTAAPTAGLRRWMRGFDLAEEAARVLAAATGVPYAALLRKPLWTTPQSALPEGRRRRMGAHVRLRPGARVAGAAVLVVDDVWTTGTTLERCAGTLLRAGARAVGVFALFRSTRGMGRLS